MGKTIDITGKRFGNLVAIRYDHSKIQKCGSRNPYWLFKCDCGNEKVIQKKSVVRGRIVSCGCQQHKLKHGLSYTRIHKIWHGIKQRCLNKNNSRYNWYGGKGIKICDEWKDSFINFYEWSVSSGYNDTLTIDRIDFNGNYCPENCRWISQKDQKRNTSKNILITYKGETLCLAALAEKYGIKFSTAYSRIKRGKPIEVVFQKHESEAINKI